MRFKGFGIITNNSLDRMVGGTLAGANYQTAETFDPANTPWLLIRIGDTDITQSGEGYWIHLSDPFDWVVTN
ncbi:MAG: hypothetical protein E3J35_08320 [Methanomassiliicoccales archaeon]|nr:MAG: hypothetical protein E3J35_08320 [Methanomassiliicoccales archaeon]